MMENHRLLAYKQGVMMSQLFVQRDAFTEAEDIQLRDAF